VLAGGITPGNLPEFLHYHAAVIDVNSGVEAQPGKKDPQLLSRLFQNLYADA
jgi:indole-3-glycerol phosphate synthase/phosphoribosylanthranilate isomerase